LGAAEYDVSEKDVRTLIFQGVAAVYSSKSGNSLKIS
jgi:hypothetical protein